MKILNHYIIILLILLGAKLGYTQPTNGSANLPSPTASNLGTYTDIPVSYYTGTPDISIPLGSASEGFLNARVSLSYHPANITPNTPASNVGKGWSLNAGGVISRMVQDQPDDDKTDGSFFVSPFDLDNGYNHSTKLAEKDLEPDIYSFNVDGLVGKFYFEGLATGDLVAKTIPKSDIIIKPILDYGILNTPIGPIPVGSGELLGFRLINTDGTIYHFGAYDGRKAVEKSTLESYKYKYNSDGDLVQDGNDVEENTVTNSWYLLYKEDHNGDNSIEYYYEDERYYYRTLANNQLEFRNYDREESIADDSRNNSGVFQGEPASRNVLTNENSTQNGFSTPRFYYGKYHNYRDNIIDGVRISRIETDLDVIEFAYKWPRQDLYPLVGDPGSLVAKQLDTVIFKTNDHNGTVQLDRNFICKKYVFDYEYYEDYKLTFDPAVTQPYGAHIKTPFLNSVQQISCDGTVEDNPYTFHYHTPETNGTKKFFPARLNKGIDHFGYYNGADGSTGGTWDNNNEKESNIPYTVIGLWDKKHNNKIIKSSGTSILSAKREPNEQYTKYGVLEKITYPTGGTAEYDYENHRYSYDELTGTNNTITLDKCSSTQTVCCNAQKSTTQSFSSLTQLEHAYVVFNLSLEPDEPTEPGSTTIPCDNEHATMRLEVKEVGATGPGAIKFIKEVNIQQFQYHYETYELPTAQFDSELNEYTGRGLRPGVDYEFKVYFTGGTYASFSLVKPGVNNQLDKLGCGLRIKSTKLSDGIEETENDIIKNYTYKIGNTNQASGVLFASPKYAVKIEHYDYAQVKTGNNSWVTYEGNMPHSLPGGNAYYQRILFSENSFMPLYGFDGVHIGYREVKETTLPTNGVSIYKYKANRNREHDVSNTMPIIPHQIDVENGQMSSTQLRNEEGDIVSETTYKAWDYPLDNIEKSRKIMKVHDAFPYEKGGIFTSHDINLIVMKEYEINRAYYQLEEITTITEGITSTKRFEYDQLNPHAAPKATIETNSDGTEKREEFFYAYEEITNQQILDSIFRKRNLLNIPIKSEIHIVKNGNKTLVDGNKTKHQLFTSAGYPLNDAYLPTGFSNYKLYPYINYAYTGNINQEDDFTGSWVPVDTMLRYNSFGGVVEARTVGGWEKMTYQYDNRQLSSSSYLNNTTGLTYYNNTRLVKSKINVDGITTDYEYDQLGRLTKSYESNNNIITDIEYLKSDLDNGDFGGVKTTVNYTPTPGSPVTQKSSVVYSDGLGRELEMISINASANGKDLITINHYDSLGRKYKETQVFEGNSNGVFTWGPVNTSREKYTITEYDASPLSRVVSVKDNNWYPILTEYLTNSAQDAVKNIEEGGYYTPNTLAKLVTINSEGNKTISFTDKFGKVILARKANSSESKTSDTYYTYDIKGRVTHIIPPGADLSDLELIYTYKYDGRGNKIEVKVPEKEKVVYVYNEIGQNVAEQDYHLRSQSKWFVSEFDNYGRVIRTGTINASGNQKPNPTNLLVSEVWGDTYYGTTGVEKNRVITSTAGIFDGFNLLPNYLTYNYEYDSYGRLSKTTKTNHLGGVNEVETDYDFAGNVMESRVTHQKDMISTPVTVVDYGTITPQGRVVNKYQTINGHTEHLAHIIYDSLGRVIRTRLGVNGKYNELQSVDNTFDAAGHLVGINASPSSDDLFSIEIGYDNGLGVANANTYTDGKIGTIRWKHSGHVWQNYTYEYDYLGQLTKAKYSELNGGQNIGAYNTEYTYDVRGNFKKVKRNGVYKNAAGAYVSTQIDNLTYSYYSNSNKLKKVTDYTIPVRVTGTGGISIPSGSRGGGSIGGVSTIGGNGNPVIGDVQMKGYHPEKTSSYYEYDNNGNTIYDPSRDIDITYNYFNLPSRIQPRGKSKEIQFLYDADGNIVQRKVVENSTIHSVTDYTGGFIYRNGVEILITEYGEAKNLATVPVYDYQIKDHLGNTRVVFSDRNGDFDIQPSEVFQINNFYPYGMSMYGSWTDLNDSFTGSDRNHFLYNGMERSEDLDLGLDFTTYRTYDPTTGRWLQVDPKSTLLPGYTPYNSMANNPVSFNDPNGDIAPALIIAIGAAVLSGTMAGIQAYKAGGSFIGGFAKGAAISIASSALTFGVGEAFGAVSSMVGKELARAVAHGVVGGAISVVQGGSFGSGFASGAASSLIGSATNGWSSTIGKIGSSALSGGVSSLISGGNFFSGAVQGAIVQTLNHGLHELQDPEVGFSVGGKTDKKLRVGGAELDVHWEMGYNGDGSSYLKLYVKNGGNVGVTPVYYDVQVNTTATFSGDNTILKFQARLRGGLGTPAPAGFRAFLEGSISGSLTYNACTGNITVNNFQSGDFYIGAQAYSPVASFTVKTNISQGFRNIAARATAPVESFQDGFRRIHQPGYLYSDEMYRDFGGN